jgi:hypothetical protein
LDGLMRLLSSYKSDAVLTCLPFLVVTIELGYPNPKCFPYASRIRLFSLVPTTMVKSSLVSLGIAGVATSARVLALAFIAMTIVLFVINGPLVVVSLSNEQGQACTNGFPLVE